MTSVFLNRALPATFLACLALAAVPLAGCGDSDPADPATPPAGSQTENPGKNGDRPAVNPGKGAPDSAGDRRDPAPDDVISERPGGPRDGGPQGSR